ncbi:hypothetical protein FGE12_07860 [Aggregicoccus sp. 17bor-14]|uniref:hypothetical protein n=1 Tax=Myxococcaceae TaxID=31 RepID=UPI00129C12DC|nr:MULTISPECIES: hypothetical protein [Myxococcaceae]MBF5042311.1 hypothetical protein [Simulacricoccus sp. 17bor-14]MRI88085.1 hypothetical protein [Aggregicoccus sp. 17bor-14]
MNTRTALLVAALLGATSALAETPMSATHLSLLSGASEAQGYAATGTTHATRGTGHLFLGGYVGLLTNSGTVPNLGIELAGPIPAALPNNLHLEWTGALDTWFDSGGGASVFNLSLIPGGRIVIPLIPEVLLHGDLGIGLGFTHVSLDTGFAGFDGSSTDVSLVFRIAAGAIIPLTDRVRLDVAPLGLQTYTTGGTGFSMRVGLSVALD